MNSKELSVEVKSTNDSRLQNKYDNSMLDTDRLRRTGFPEVIFCQGKSNEQLLEIYQKMAAANQRFFGTRASQEQYEFVKKELDRVSYDPVSRLLKYDYPPAPSVAGNPTYIAVCTAGTSDIPVAEEAAQTAEFFGSRVERAYDIGVCGIHRVLSKQELLANASCCITVAGMEGALASVVGGLVSVPVIAVPTSVGYGASFAGITALLAMLNSCANGITVVNIDNGYGAGYSACQIDRLARGIKHSS